MLFTTRKPSPPLSAFVDSFWYFSGGGLPHRRERILPDGSAELVINLDDVVRKRFDRGDCARFETVRRAWFSGPLSEYAVIDVLPQATMVGVHFKPGGLAPFVAMPVHELRDGLVELDLVWGVAARDLRDALLEAREVPEKFDVLERFLSWRALRPLQPDPLLDAAMAALGSRMQTLSVARVADDAGFSHKHFIERFQTTVGLSPKRFSRILRFQRALCGMRSRREVDWCGVALDCGYFDQAHFIRDFRAFSGLTPGGYRVVEGADERFVPIHD